MVGSAEVQEMLWDRLLLPSPARWIHGYMIR